jgi:uncharacterized protein (DUF736 family)
MSTSPSQTESAKPKSDYASRKVGALWIRTSGAGNKYLSGQLDLKLADGTTETIQVNVLKTTFRAPGDKRPDYEVVLRTPRTGGPSAPVESLDPDSGL